MIRIRCSELENARENPSAYGQLLAVNDFSNGGGHGMLACVREVALAMGKEKFSASQGIKQIQQKFLAFSPTKGNKERQEDLIQGFAQYCKQMEKFAFELVDNSRMMKWDFSKDVMLTGKTPLVFANDEGYFALTLIETNTSWQHQLKFPLYQQYLTTHTIDCPLTEMSIGVFCLQSGKFEFKSFEEESIEACVNETTQILNAVLDSYTKYKK